ncbi:MAG TPA: ATP-binding protein [Vicinamibacterales bacterium]|nr:ATP-binding protein [Vicinamibacterales bacterium]
MDTTSLVDRLAAHRTLQGVPRQQLAWLASRGELRRFNVGDVTYREGDVIPVLQVMLTGRIVIRSGAAAGSRKMAEWGAGDITGALPYSRMGGSPGTVTVTEATEFLTLGREHFPEMTQCCYELTQVLVNVMVDRARKFKSNELQNEKMRSLGQQAARLTHELNNPASAVARSARSLEACIALFDEAARRFGGLALSDEQSQTVRRLVTEIAPQQAPLSPLARAEREDAVTEWLDDRDIAADDIGFLVDSAVSVEQLESIASAVPRDALPTVLGYVSGMLNARRLSAEIESAASRIHGLVSAVKRFTYMDQTDIPGPVDIAQGLADTVLMQRTKAQSKKADLTLEVAPQLPKIEGFGGELNQVWLNLIDNALDAVPEGGRVVVSASADGNQSVVVRVIDDGPGIPRDIRDRIFEPFFTTKPVGVGTGLGLDTARALVERHGGEIEVENVERGTVFRVSLPTVWRGQTQPT